MTFIQKIAVLTLAFTSATFALAQDSLSLLASSCCMTPFESSTEVGTMPVQVVNQASDAELLMPVEGIYLDQVSDTWGAARSEGRRHEGVDIFAPEGTAVYSAPPGYVEWIGPYGIGGNTVTVVGVGGVRYYYAHLSGYADDLINGRAVTPETLLGYVGTTGNAATTPPHLHFGVYTGFWDAENPYPLLVDRTW